MKYINQPVIKKDAYALLSGKPVYTDDLAPADCLVIKLLRSPHAHARIKSIDTVLRNAFPVSKPYLPIRMFLHQDSRWQGRPIPSHPHMIV